MTLTNSKTKGSLFYYNGKIHHVREGRSKESEGANLHILRHFKLTDLVCKSLLFVNLHDIMRILHSKSLLFVNLHDIMRILHIKSSLSLL